MVQAEDDFCAPAALGDVRGASSSGPGIVLNSELPCSRRGRYHLDTIHV
eukprot:COSAG06_NODE_6751_length_2798_cov_4.781030_2_plen_49_part_00